MDERDLLINNAYVYLITRETEYVNLAGGNQANSHRLWRGISLCSRENSWEFRLNKKAREGFIRN